MTMNKQSENIEVIISYMESNESDHSTCRDIWELMYKPNNCHTCGEEINIGYLICNDCLKELWDCLVLRKRRQLNNNEIHKLIKLWHI